MSNKMKRGQQLNRIPVHDIGLNSVDENDTVAHSEEVHKTSSILSGRFTTKMLLFCFKRD
jgi:hypothetical protein